MKNKLKNFLNSDIPIYSHWAMKMWYAPIFVGMLIYSLWFPMVLVYFVLGMFTRFCFDMCNR